MTSAATNAVRSVVTIDRPRLHIEAISWIEHYMDCNKPELAYDVLIAEITRNDYAPSELAIDLIKLAAVNFGLVYPDLTR